MKQGFSAIAKEIRNRESEGIRVNGRKCSVGEFIKTLTEAEKQEFIDLVKNPNITQISIIEVLEKNGVQLNANQFSKHFLNRCRCKYEK
jgi:hypothetical protein